MRALRRTTTYITQPDYPNPDFTSGITSPLTSPLSSPPGGATHLGLGDGTYIVYLDAWRREITALDDRQIREVALGGPDTSTRLKTVWQVRFLPRDRGGNVRPTCNTSFNEWNDLPAAALERLNARTKSPDDPKDPCLLPPSAGYRRLENQLYRVEIHTGGARDVATFKWSRDNATVETSVEQIAGNTVTVADVGKDDVLGFANGQWVEVVDDESELKAAPRPLVQIDGRGARDAQDHHDDVARLPGEHDSCETPAVGPERHCDGDGVHRRRIGSIWRAVSRSSSQKAIIALATIG